MESIIKSDGNGGWIFSKIHTAVLLTIVVCTLIGAFAVRNDTLDRLDRLSSTTESRIHTLEISAAERGATLDAIKSQLDRMERKLDGQ